MEAVSSITTQTYRPIECIIVDDGSTDNTKDIVNKIEIPDISSFTVKYIYQQNSGSQVARNTGTAAAIGEFIQYLDSDDLLCRDKIANQVNYFNQHPDCDAVFGDWEVGTKEKKDCITAYKKENLLDQFLTEKCIANFAILMRSNLVTKIGDWDVNIKRNQEIDFHLRGVLAGGKFEYLAGLCGLWRVRDGERIVSNTGLADALHFFNKWENIIRQKNLLTDKLSIKLSDMYFYLFMKYISGKRDLLVQTLEKVVLLNPQVKFFNTFKMKLLKTLFGRRITLNAWIFYSNPSFLRKYFNAVKWLNG